jgi:hypothetical protein
MFWLYFRSARDFTRFVLVFVKFSVMKILLASFLRFLLELYTFSINSYCFWVFFPCHSCTELYVNIYLPSNLCPLKSTILLQFHPPYNFYAVNPGQITLFFPIMLKINIYIQFSTWMARKKNSKTITINLR